MPIYEYECPRCGRFDVLQKMSAPTLETHEVCGSKVRKLMSASAFAFKGSGFYITDYKSRNDAATTGKGEPKAEKGCEAAKPSSEACASCPASKTAA
jgi:putative FmdB family regulatory protein